MNPLKTNNAVNLPHPHEFFTEYQYGIVRAVSRASEVDEIRFGYMVAELMWGTHHAMPFPKAVKIVFDATFPVDSTVSAPLNEIKEFERQLSGRFGP